MVFEKFSEILTTHGCARRALFYGARGRTGNFRRLLDQAGYYAGCGVCVPFRNSEIQNSEIQNLAIFYLYIIVKVFLYI